MWDMKMREEAEDEGENIKVRIHRYSFIQIGIVASLS